MPELTSPPSKQGGRNKRVIILGVILVCIFVVWVVTMIVSSGRL